MGHRGLIVHVRLPHEPDILFLILPERETAEDGQARAVLFHLDVHRFVRPAHRRRFRAWCATGRSTFKGEGKAELSGFVAHHSKYQLGFRAAGVGGGCDSEKGNSHVCARAPRDVHGPSNHARRAATLFKRENIRNGIHGRAKTFSRCNFVPRLGVTVKPSHLAAPILGRPPFHC